jgi:hypothetical protein
MFPLIGKQDVSWVANSSRGSIPLKVAISHNTDRSNILCEFKFQNMGRDYVQTIYFPLQIFIPAHDDLLFARWRNALMNLSPPQPSATAARLPSDALRDVVRAGLEVGCHRDLPMAQMCVAMSQNGIDANLFFMESIIVITKIIEPVNVI